MTTHCVPKHVQFEFVLRASREWDLAYEHALVNTDGGASAVNAANKKGCEAYMATMKSLEAEYLVARELSGATTNSTESQNGS